MQKYIQRHEDKIESSVVWLARWGISDAYTLAQTADLYGEGIPILQSSSWASLLVKRGFATTVKPSNTKHRIAGTHKVFVATRTARQFAREILESRDKVSKFEKLGSPPNLEEAAEVWWHHRLLTQRAMITYMRGKRLDGFVLDGYVVDGAEMKVRSKAEYLAREPDAIISMFRPGTNERGEEYIRHAIEIERTAKSGEKFDAMRSGIATLLRARESEALTSLDSCWIVCKTPRIRDNYKEQMEKGTIYPHYALVKVVVDKIEKMVFKATGNTRKMPGGIDFISFEGLANYKKAVDAEIERRRKIIVQQRRNAKNPVGQDAKPT